MTLLEINQKNNRKNLRLFFCVFPHAKQSCLDIEIM